MKVKKQMTLEELRAYYGNKDFLFVANSLFKELGNYGINVVSTHFSCDNHFLYSSSEIVKGENLWECAIDEEFISQVKRLYFSIATYFVDKWNNGGFYLADINSGKQYVYGTISKDSFPKIYLVDMDLYFGEGREGLFRVMQWFALHTKGMELQCKTSFDEVRSIIIESDIPKIDEIKIFVEGGSFISDPPTPAIPVFENPLV